MNSNCLFSLGRASTWRSDWWVFADSCIDNSLLNSNLFTKSLKWILSLKFLELNWGVLIQELIKGKITSSNSDLDIVLLNLDSNSLGTELVNTFGLSHEHNLEFGSFRVVVDELGELSVNGIILNWDVNSNSLFQVNDVLLKSLNLNLSILELFQKLKGSLVGLVDFFLEGDDVVGGLIKIILNLLLLLDEGGIVLLVSSELGFNISFVGDNLFQFEVGGLLAQNSCCQLLDLDLLGVDVELGLLSVQFKSVLELSKLTIFLLAHLS